MSSLFRKSSDKLSTISSQQTAHEKNNQHNKYSTMKFACIMFRSSDRINVSGFSTDAIDAMSKAIDKTWTKGIQDQSIQSESTLFKLSGNPWNHNNFLDGPLIESRRMVCGILRALYDFGWQVETGTNLTGNENGKGAVMFKKTSSTPPRMWFAMHFYKGDTVTFIDAPEELASALQLRLGHRLQSSKGQDGTFSTKFKGSPFFGAWSKDDEMRAILIELREVLDSCGFRLYTSIDLAGSQNGPDSWFCCTS